MLPKVKFVPLLIIFINLSICFLKVQGLTECKMNEKWKDNTFQKSEHSFEFHV